MNIFCLISYHPTRASRCVVINYEITCTNFTYAEVSSILQGSSWRLELNRPLIAEFGLAAVTMSSQHKSKSKAGKQLTRWSDWEWSNEYNRNYRYRKHSDGELFARFPPFSSNFSRAVTNTSMPKKMSLVIRMDSMRGETTMRKQQQPWTKIQLKPMPTTSVIRLRITTYLTPQLARDMNLTRAFQWNPRMVW